MLKELFQHPELSSVQVIKIGIEHDNVFKQFGFIEGEKDKDGFITFTYPLSELESQ